MYNLCIHKPIYHTQTPKYPEHSPMNLFDSLLTITYGCLPNLEKPLVIQHEFPFTGHTQYAYGILTTAEPLAMGACFFF